MPPVGICERLHLDRLPPAILRYCWCVPKLDFVFRCLPGPGGLYGQRYRDFLEFSIIEGRLRVIEHRKRPSTVGSTTKTVRMPAGARWRSRSR